MASPSISRPDKEWRDLDRDRPASGMSAFFLACINGVAGLNLE
jgi:hypothetical protein